jgi:5-methyltetrahydrofolate--homocysteine methyltransferase
VTGEDRNVLSWLGERRLLVAYGARGTALQEADLPPGGCPEIWNLERPETIEAILADYLDAGAEILQTNTFGGSPARLGVHGLQDRCAEINRAAAGMARAVAGTGALVAGSIGPSGHLLAPLGPLGADEALDGFRLQADALAEGGVDTLIIETMTDLQEASLAVKAAASTGLPVIACMTFELTPRGIFTVFGASPESAASELEAAGARLLGTNCGTGPTTMVEMVRALRSTTSLPLIARPNAGIPVIKGLRIDYPETPEKMAAHVAPLVQAGASIVGGCCGTTTDKVRAMAAEIRRLRNGA